MILRQWKKNQRVGDYVGWLFANSRFGYIPRPGGDKIGRRRVDTHFDGLISVGADFTYDRENPYIVQADRLKGAYLLSSIGIITGTANLVMAAVLAEGTTMIYNAACEPYLQQLWYAQKNGCQNLWRWINESVLTIEGVTSLSGTTHRVLPDMVEIGSWIGLALTQKQIDNQERFLGQFGQIPSVSKIGDSGLTRG